MLPQGGFGGTSCATLGTIGLAVEVTPSRYLSLTCFSLSIWSHFAVAFKYSLKFDDLVFRWQPRVSSTSSPAQLQMKLATHRFPK